MALGFWRSLHFCVLHLHCLFLGGEEPSIDHIFLALVDSVKRAQAATTADGKSQIEGNSREMLFPCPQPQGSQAGPQFT